MIAGLSWDQRNKNMSTTNIVNEESCKGNEQEEMKSANPENEYMQKEFQAEQKMFIDTFNKLGRKINSAYKVVQNAKNIHKSIRDDITCALALFEQIQASKCSIADMINIKAANKRAKSPPQTKETQTNTYCPSEQIKEGKRGRIMRSKSPDCGNQSKKLITADTPRSTQNLINENVQPYQEEDEKTEWKIVKRKEKRKKKNTKSRKKHEIGEAMTIKANRDVTYADIIKEMKKNIDPVEMGIDIKTMRRTRTGDILISFNKGEGQVEKLSRAIGNTFGDDVTTRAVTKTCVVDIRDMDESTEEDDIRNALISATNVLPSEIKVLHVREAFGKTKQAIVQIPENVAASLLQSRKIRIGWVICRIRRKAKPTQCFRCLEYGHMASTCKGEDRSNLCKRCCNDGHKAKDCKEKVRCILCQKDGIGNFEHLIGSTLCANNRRERRRNV